MTRKQIIYELRNRGYETESIDSVKNGTTLHGISIGTGLVRPAIYVDEYLNRNDIDDVVDDILYIYDNSIKNVPNIETTDLKGLLKWENVKDHLQLCLQKRSSEHIVKRNFLNVEQYVRVVLGSYNGNKASFKVTPEHLTQFGVAEFELFETAFQNSKKEFVAEDMFDVIVNMMPSSTDIEELKMLTGDVIQIVVSNKDKLHGAAAICDTELLSKIADKYESDLAIIPSSIHECILMPINNDTDFIELDTMIQEVNETEVKPEEVLSDSAYRFIRDEKRIIYKKQTRKPRSFSYVDEL